MKKESVLILFFIILSGFAFSQSSGRVQIKDGTLVSDAGTLLRGAYVSTDVTDQLPLREEISAVKNLGLNCIHLYAECPQLQSPGDRIIQIDSIVSWTEKDSLYLIITIGGCDNNGQFDSAFVWNFWNLYAPRYKDKTHVIYEIVNEPYAWSSPYDSATIAMEVWAYNLIRFHAPDTHILFMSYAKAINDSNIIDDIGRLEKSAEIDWNNASIATHGYSAPSENIREFIHTLKDAGFTITFTEPESVANKYLNLATTRVFEEEFVSYTHFISLGKLLKDPAVFIERVESSELRWQPDFNSWPLSIKEINYINPFQTIPAGFYDEGFGFIGEHGGYVLGFIDNNDYVAYYNFSFAENPDSFIVECASGSQGGTIEIYLDSLNGDLIGECLITNTGDWETFKKFSCKVFPFKGIHKIYLVFKGEYSGLMDIKSIVFIKSTVTGISKTKSRNDLLIYPNPAAKVLFINSEENATLEIYTLNGVLMFSQNLYPNRNIIPIEFLPVGIYIAKIINSKGAISEQLIVGNR